MDKERYSQYLGWLTILIGIIVILYLMLIFISYERDVIQINIENSTFKEVKVGFQRTSLANGLFDNTPQGDLRLYIDAISLERNENVYTYSKNVGQGIFFISDILFPTKNETWNFRFQLKNQENEVLGEVCYQIKYYIKQNGKEIETNAIECNR